MPKIKKSQNIRTMLFGMLFGVLFVGGAFACATNEIDALGDGSQCENSSFELTTTSDTSVFYFSMSAEGEFYVDCGDGGTLAQGVYEPNNSTVTANTITRNGTYATTYRCLWPSAGEHTIRFGGYATGYSPDVTTAAISFRVIAMPSTLIVQNSGDNTNEEKIASVDGSLTMIFGQVDDTVPRFYRTFGQAWNLTEIPNELFSGIYTDNVTDTSYMFYETFLGCEGLTSVPSSLFGSIDTSEATDTSYMFKGTFYMSGLAGSIPAGLFDSIDTSNATNTSHMFDGTFYGCYDLTNMYGGLFERIDTSNATDTSYMFNETFAFIDLTSIPAGLFSTIDTSSATNTSSMFESTFSNCSNLSSIPAGLFSTIDTSSATDTSSMFRSTFYGCSNLSSYIPPTTFPGTIQPGSSSSTDMWYRTFYYTQLLTACPAGTTQYITGFESDWGYNNGNVPADDGSTRVSCEPCPGTLPEHASYTTAGTCDWACDSGYMNTGTSCESAKFTVTTTELESGTPFTFSISASGTFFVDCGNGGTLSGDGVVGNMITRSGTTAAEYTCSWENAGANTIQFAGVATGYSTTNNVAAISFYGGNKTPTLIASIDGSLGAIFPTIAGGGDGNQPRFFETFRGASNFLGPIPATLFSGVTGAPVSRMFNGTFRSTGLQTAIPSGLFAGLDGAPTTELFANTWRNCQNMTGPIPEDLFAGIHGAPATKMFFGTFAANANDGGEGWAGENGKITGSIPAGLFAGISGAPAANMFHETFSGQSRLTGTIPENLFAGITGKPAQWMFGFTFNGCSGLTGGIPGNLFAGISGAPAASMFAFTFRYCSSLTGSIPENLFAGLDGAPAARMFRQTFASCSGLTGSIPENLFAGLNGAPQTYMFLQTFYRCSNLTGPIPSNLFAGVRGAPAYGMFTGTFGYCSKLSGAIPSDLFANISGAPAAEMFFGTFTGCSSLSGTLPASLFAGISGAPKSNMFTTTFAGCSSLSGYIPPTFFAGISTSTTIDDQMTNVFNNSGLDTECPDGMTQYMTGFENFFTGKVSCEIVCDNGYHSDNNMCIANIININWSDASDEDIAATNAATTTYGGDIHTPRAAAYKLGKIFRGWLFNKSDGNGDGD